MRMHATSPSATTGIIGGGQVFNSASKVLIPDNATEFDWNGDASFSIELWIKTTSAADMVCVARNRQDIANSTFWFIGTNAGGTAQFELRDSWGNYAATTGNVPVNDGLWHQVIAVRDGAAGKNIIIVDGAKDAETAVVYPHSFSAEVERDPCFCRLS